MFSTIIDILTIPAMIWTAYLIYQAKVETEVFLVKGLAYLMTFQAAWVTMIHLLK